MEILRSLFKNKSKQEAIKKALNCKGWTNELKLSLLFDLAQETKRLPGDILEIGSAWGRSTVLFGFASSKTIWSIDPHTGGIAFIKRDENQNSFNEFIENIKRFGLTDRIKILKNTTQEVIDFRLLPENTRFSLIFIDGLHTAEGVKVDFEFAYEYLVDSGVMVFDDYFEPSVPDYSQMINLLLISQNNLDLVKDKITRLAYFFKPKI